MPVNTGIFALSTASEKKFRIFLAVLGAIFAPNHSTLYLATIYVFCGISQLMF